MTAICAPGVMGLWTLAPSSTPAASTEATQRTKEWLRAANEDATFEKDAVAFDIEDELTKVLLRARQAVQQQVRYLSSTEVTAINSQLSSLLSPDSWEDGDALLRLSSVRTMLRTIIELDQGAGEMTRSRNGNLVSTWSFDDHVIRVEATTGGTVSWTLIHPRGTEPRQEHTTDDSVANLKQVLDQLLGRSGGHPRRG